MNKSNILELRNFIRDAGLKFNMMDPYAAIACEVNKCGSAGCIGGHASILWPDIRFIGPWGDIFNNEVTWNRKKFCDKLGITLTQEEELCYCLGNNEVFIAKITREHAVKTLEKLVETGEVDWSHAV